MLCWFFRLAISHAADTDKPLSAAAKKHVNKCPDCREFYYLCLAMGQDLTRQAAAFSRGTPASLTDRILEGIAGSKTETYGIRIKFRPIAVAACIALIAFAGFFFLVRQKYNQRKNEIDKTVAAFHSLVGQDLSSGLAELVEKPLAGELQNIVDDGEAAARFLWTCVAVLDSQSPLLDEDAPTR